MRLSSISVVCATLALLFVSCQKQPPPQKTLWKGTITLAGQKELPFELYLDLTPPAPSGYFLNGSEQTPIPEIYQNGDSLSFRFSEYGAAMDAVWRDGQYVGEFKRFRRDTVKNSFELSPMSSGGIASAQKPTPGVPLVGKFQVYLKNEEGIDSTSAATFWARGDSVFGTIIAPDGDYGLMVGTQSGDTVRLGRFTGWQGQFMELTRVENRWSGTIFYRMPPSLSFELQPRTTASATSPASKRPVIANTHQPFRFSGVTVMGDTITNSDARFKGKALIVDIMGTWCHNCMDAAPLLQKLYSDFGKQGLEVVSLSFEITDNPQMARKNLLLFQERYGIGYTVLFCGSTGKANVEEKLRSQIKNFAAYPTTLFIDRKGIVQQIHEGFIGPGVRDEYQEQVNTYYDTMRKLVGERSASR